MRAQAGLCAGAAETRAWRRLIAPRTSRPDELAILRNATLDNKGVAFVLQETRRRRRRRRRPSELESFRRSLGFTLTALSDRSGVDLSLLSRLESGKRRLTLATAARLLEAIRQPTEAVK